MGSRSSFGYVSLSFVTVSWVRATCVAHISRAFVAEAGKTFVTWIHVARTLPAPNRYQIVFLSQPEILWQRRSMHALSCVATDMVRLQG